MAVDYNYYTNTYKGNSIPENDFDRLIIRAKGYLKRFRAVDETDNDTMMALCAIAEAWQENEQGIVTSQSVGSWSKSVEKEKKSNEQRLYEAARMYVNISNVGWC